MKIMKIARWQIYGLGGLTLLMIVGFAWNWYRPALGTTTAAPKPVVKKAQPTRLEEKKTAPQTVAREVVRRVPISLKVREKIEEKYDVKLSSATSDSDGTPTSIEPGTIDLLTEVALPALPFGGEAIATLDAAGRTEIKVLPNKRPFFQLGGIRESGVFYDVIRGAAGAYHEQDVMRTGQVIWSARGFVSTPVPPLLGTIETQQGLNYGLELRGGIRW